MKLFEILTVLQKRLPIYTSWFSDSISIIGADVANKTITFETNIEHNLVKRKSIYVANIINACEITNINAEPPTYTIKTKDDHGLSFNEDDLQIEIASPLSSLDVDVVAINSPTSLIVSTPYGLPTSDAYIALNEGFNGFYNVIDVPNSTHFTVHYPDVYTNPYEMKGTGIMATNVRVMGVADMDRFNAIYTEQNINELWLAITPPENRASRDRGVTTDAISGYMDSSFYSSETEVRQLHTETISVYCAIPARETLDGRAAIDIAEEVRFILYNTLCGIRIPTLSSTNEISPLMPVRDGYFSYLTDNTTYIHEYVFERSVVLTNEDLGENDDRTAPMRGLDLSVMHCVDFFEANK